MLKKQTVLLLLIPIATCLAVFYPLFFEDKLFAEITPLQIGYSIKDYFFTDFKFSWIYSLNLMGDPILTNPTYGILSVQSISYLFLPNEMAYKFNYILGFLIFYIFSYKILQERSDKLTSALLPILFLSTPLLLSMTQRQAFWQVVWIPATIYTFQIAIRTNSRFLFFILGVLLSRSFSLGEPLLFLLLPLIVHINTKFLVTNNYTFTISGLLLGLAPFLTYYLELRPLTFRYYGQSVETALSYSFDHTRVLELISKDLFQTYQSLTWFPSVSLGVSLFLIFIFILSKSRPSTIIPLVLIAITVVLLSLGINTDISSYLWTNTPLLNQLRFPEKLIVYLYVIILTTVYLNSKMLLKSKVLSFLIIFGIFENIYNVPNFKYIAQESIVNKSFMKKYQGKNTRFMICTDGLRPFTSKIAPNLRAFGVATLNTTSNIASTALKLVNCRNILSDNNAKRLGVSHILASNLTKSEEGQLEKANWTLEQKDNLYSIYRLENSSPLTANFTTNSRLGRFLKYKGKKFNENTAPNWEYTVVDDMFLLDNGALKRRRALLKESNCSEELEGLQINSSFGSQKLEVITRNKCAGILQVPWYFTPGWKAYVNNTQVPIYRINDISMGLNLTKGTNKVQLLYLPKKWPIFLSIFTILVLILSPIILKIRKIKLIRHHKV